MVVAFVGCWVVHKITNGIMDKPNERYFRWGRSARPPLSRSRTAPTTQKTMGVMTLALIAAGHWDAGSGSVPVWVQVSAASAIALGTYIGGWRIIRTLGRGSSTSRLGRVWRPTARPRRSSSRRATSASPCRRRTSRPGRSSVGPRPGAPVRWNTAGRMVVAWRRLSRWRRRSARSFYIGHLLGYTGGPIVVFALLCAVSGWMFMRSRQQPSAPHNVNEEWDRARDVLDQNELTTTAPRGH